jgi:hypothetical protein
VSNGSQLSKFSDGLRLSHEFELNPMLHVVEIRFSAENFKDLIARLRSWLNDESFRPRTFHYSLCEPDSVLRVDFELETDAHAFAQAFGGVILG